MQRIEKLKEKIDTLYQTENSNRDEWANWLYKNHVFVVADNAKKFAERFGADVDLSVAAGMLHDVADAIMKRVDEGHKEKSFEIAREFLQESGFSENEIKIIVDDAILFHGCHGCHGDGVPTSLEGKVMATADAVAHISSDFYKYAIQYKRDRKDLKEWGLKKIERDFYSKIFFDDVREEVREDYEKAKDLFKVL